MIKDLTSISLEKRSSPRITISFPINVPPDLKGRLINISTSGICFWLNKSLPFAKSLVAIQLHNKAFIQTEINIIWGNTLEPDKKFIYGGAFANLEEKDSKLLEDIIKNKSNIYCKA